MVVILVLLVVINDTAEAHWGSHGVGTAGERVRITVSGGIVTVDSSTGGSVVHKFEEGAVGHFHHLLD